MNSTDINQLPVSLAVKAERLHRLQSELRYAWSQISCEDVLGWGTASGSGFVGAAGRRVKNVINLAKSTAGFLGNEAQAGYRAWVNDRLTMYLQDRAVDAGNTVLQTYRSVTDFAGQFAEGR